MIAMVNGLTVLTDLVICADAGMMKLVNMLDLGSSAAMLVGSSPTTRTSSEIPNTAPFPPDGENCALLGISSPPNRTRWRWASVWGRRRLDAAAVSLRAMVEKRTSVRMSFLFILG